MTKSQVLRENSRGSAKKNCAGELCCTPAGRWTLVCSKPCRSGARQSYRCILCNRSAELLCHRWKARFSRSKGKRRRCEWLGGLPGDFAGSPCASRGGRKFFITRQRQRAPGMCSPVREQAPQCSPPFGVNGSEPF